MMVNTLDDELEVITRPDGDFTIISFNNNDCDPPILFSNDGTGPEVTTSRPKRKRKYKKSVTPASLSMKICIRAAETFTHTGNSSREVQVLEARINMLGRTLTSLRPDDRSIPVQLDLAKQLLAEFEEISQGQDFSKVDKH